MLKDITTEVYELHILSDDQKDHLARYGMGVECADGVVPNVYGVYNKETKVYEHYCANMPQAMSIISTLQRGIDEEKQEYEKRSKENNKPSLRTV